MGYCERSAEFLFGDALGDPVADELRAALLRSPSGVTKTEIRDLFGRNRRAGDLGIVPSPCSSITVSRGGWWKRTAGRSATRWVAASSANGGPP